MANQLKTIKLTRFTSFLHQPNQTQSPEPSPTDNLITLILYYLNQWLTAISNLFTTFFTPETRTLLADHWLMITAGAVLFLCFMCCCLPAILRCFAWVLVGCFNLIKGFFMMVFNAIKSVFRCLCCCCARSGKMMKAPGTGGRLFIQRAGFEMNPAAYFQNLRATPLLN